TCPPGRFIVASGSSPLLFSTGSSSLEVITLSSGAQLSLTECAATHAKPVASKKFTSVTARWPHCGSFSKVRLRVKLPSPMCEPLQGTIKAKKPALKAFTATLSSCGDGVLDPDGGEVCDATAPGGDAACPGLCNAPGTAGACQCGIAQESTTTTTVTTT